MIKYFLQSLLILGLYFLHFGLQAGEEKTSPARSLKVLHLTLHKGCAEEIEAVAKELSLDLTTWLIQSLPPYWFDGFAQGNALYNIGHERAERVWNLHKDFFNSFDAIITSDTAPLSRIFVQNKWKKPLIIWICNRFDYHDHSSLDCEFPDKEYYELFAKACTQKNVKVIGYTAYEHRYTKIKGVDTGSEVIKPTGKFIKEGLESLIPSHVKKSDTFFLPPYHNELHFINASKYYSSLGIENYCGRYNGSRDLEGFKAIIHLPYAWSNLALFENLYLGTPYLIPSPKFMEELIRQDNYFLTTDVTAFYLSEWYDPANAPFFIFFDSWEDLSIKIKTIDFTARREVVKKLGQEHAEKTLQKWRKVFGIES